MKIDEVVITPLQAECRLLPREGYFSNIMANLSCGTVALLILWNSDSQIVVLAF